MSQKNRKMLFPAARPLLAACALTMFAAAGFAQSSSSSSSQTGTPAPGTTAAPGTVAIHTHAAAQQITPNRVATYDERFEVFGGLSFMNGQAGQNLPKRYNMGGGEGMVTYWLGRHLGVAGDFRSEAGTTPILPYGAEFGLNRVRVNQNIGSGGINYRGPKNRYAAIDFHALAGVTHGSFDSAIVNYPQGQPVEPQLALTGLYSNRTSPWAAAGGSIDFNYSPKLAVRLSPDLIFEHFGTETREFVSIGGGVVYRFGKRRK